MKSSITDSKLSQNNSMNVNENSDVKTADENSRLKTIIKEDKKEKESLFTVIINKY